MKKQLRSVLFGDKKRQQLTKQQLYGSFTGRLYTT